MTSRLKADEMAKLFSGTLNSTTIVYVYYFRLSFEFCFIIAISIHNRKMKMLLQAKSLIETEGMAFLSAVLTISDPRAK